ncbi:MAG: hypothetical protein LBI05_02835 [Planctomycetaceae bacterium]|nr:hypothetical protein [Planctomycetaceae bacterium]
MRSLCYQILYQGISLFFPEGVTKDYWYLKGSFQGHLNRPLSLENPQRFSEKIQWLKLYDRNPLHTMKADKYSVIRNR